MGETVKRLLPAVLEVAFKSRRLAGAVVFVWGCYEIFNREGMEVLIRVALVLAAAFVVGCWLTSQGNVEMALVEKTGEDPEDGTTTVRTSGAAAVSVTPTAPEVKP